LRVSFATAIEKAIEHAMAEDERIIIFGEDVHLLRNNLYARFGPERIIPAPISESAFLGAAVGVAMAGLKPIVEIMLVDFIAVAFDALLNQASKVKAFSGGKWNVPVVIRCSCGGGYGDAGQHEQCLWGLISSVPGISVVVPSNPPDAAGLMLSALNAEDPVVYLEHKLLSEYWLDYLGAGGRKNVAFDIPESGASGEIEIPPKNVAIGKASFLREGSDITFISIGVSVHRCLEASKALEREDASSCVLDLRTATPLDKESILEASRTGRVVVVDEDYLSFGLSGEIAAVLSESGYRGAFTRVGNTGVIPYARHLEDRALPSVDSIYEAAKKILGT